MHEASTANIVLRVFYQPDHGDSPAVSETHDAMNSIRINEPEQKPSWAESIPQRRLRWLLKRHPRMNIEKLRLWSD